MPLDNPKLRRSTLRGENLYVEGEQEPSESIQLQQQAKQLPELPRLEAPALQAQHLTSSALSTREEPQGLPSGLRHRCERVIAWPEATDVCCVRCSGGLLTPTPPAEKTTARQDQARQSGAGDRARDSRSRSRPKGIVELKAAGDLT